MTAAGTARMRGRCPRALRLAILAMYLTAVGAEARAGPPDRGPEPPPGGYRFRGDPEPRGWDGAPLGDEGADQSLRFRPLNERERERMRETPGWRPLEPRRDSGIRPPGLIDAMTTPPVPDLAPLPPPGWP